MPSSQFKLGLAGKLFRSNAGAFSSLPRGILSIKLRSAGEKENAPHGTASNLVSQFIIPVTDRTA